MPLLSIKNLSIEFPDRCETGYAVDDILKVRGSGVSFISRHPMPSQNPLFTVGNQLVENITTDLDLGAKEAQTLNLLKGRQDEPGLKFLSIGRDLPVIRPICDQVAFMRRGTILENAETKKFFWASLKRLLQGTAQPDTALRAYLRAKGSNRATSIIFSRFPGERPRPSKQSPTEN